MRCSLYVFGLICLFAPATGFAQFDRIDNVISNIENRFVEKWEFIPTIENAEGFPPGIVNAALLSPLQWELEKLETRAEILEALTLERSQRLDRLNEKIAALDLQLQEIGIFGEEDLQEITRRKSALKHELKSVNAQTEALKVLAAEKQENPAAEIRVQSAMQKYRSLQTELAQAELNVERQRQLFTSGVVPSANRESLEAKAESMRSQVRAAELDVELARVEAQFSPELSGELRKVTIVRDQLQAQFEELSAESENLREARKILAERKQLEFEQQLLRRRLIEMTEQQETVGLEKTYLFTVLSKYQKMPARSSDSVK